MMQRLPKILLGGLIFLMVGCGETPPPMGSLSGVVTSNGDPCGDCRVRIYHTQLRRYSGGVVDSEGKFKVSELPLGDYQVSVDQPPPMTLKDDPFDKRIPRRYRREATSGFEIVIEEGDNEIKLEMAR